MGNGLIMYMMVMEDARQWNEANREISIGKRNTNFPITTCSLKSFICTILEVIAFQREITAMTADTAFTGRDLHNKRSRTQYLANTFQQ